jgi:histone-lysine N-methyltransferase SETD3
VPEEDSFIIYSEKYIFKNIEIFDTYGPKCNSRYFVNYGFTLKDNQEYNQGAIFIDPAKILNTYTMNENKLNLLKNMETTIDDSFCNYGYLIKSKKETNVSINKCFRFQFIILSDKKVDSQPKTMTGLHSIWCLFGMLRLLLSSNEEFIKITHNIKESKDFIQILLSISPLSTENELAVLKELSFICNESLTNFDTTLEMDEKELETVEPYSNKWNILNILIGEKRVLIYYRDLGLYVNSFNEYHKIGRNLRKHNIFSSYYKVYWEHFLF